MKCSALYHVRFEDLGSFAGPLARSGYAIEYRHAGADPVSADEWCDADLVVVLGGPIGVGYARPIHGWKGRGMAYGAG
jgi:GMP synthase (glutamine-hydrolysing)